MTTATMTAPKIVNGVNVTAMMDVIEAVKGNKDIAKFNFRLTNKWSEGDRNRSTIKDFTGALGEQRADGKSFVFDNGEHQILLGKDEAPNPVEWVLHALAGCLTTTTAYHAAARDIQIDAIESALDGDLDLRGFLGLSEEVRKGYSVINVRMRVKTKAHASTIKMLTGLSPVYDIVSKSVPVNITVETY